MRTAAPTYVYFLYSIPLFIKFCKSFLFLFLFLIQKICGKLKKIKIKIFSFLTLPPLSSPSTHIPSLANVHSPKLINYDYPHPFPGPSTHLNSSIRFRFSRNDLNQPWINSRQQALPGLAIDPPPAAGIDIWQGYVSDIPLSGVNAFGFLLNWKGIKSLTVLCFYNSYFFTDRCSRL